MDFVIGRLKDKSSNVRKAAIKFLTRSIEQSPFTCIAEDKGRLSLTFFQGKSAKLEEIIKVDLVVIKNRLNVLLK